MYYIKFFYFILFWQKLIPDRNINFSHKMEVRDPTSFSQKHDIDLIPFWKKWTTYFHLLEKIKLKMWVSSFLKKLSEKWNHLELNQCTICQKVADMKGFLIRGFKTAKFILLTKEQINIKELKTLTAYLLILHWRFFKKIIYHWNSW